MNVSLYDLSVRILGNVPPEFCFLNYLVVFGLLLVIILTILSPFYLVYKLLEAIY